MFVPRQHIGPFSGLSLHCLIAGMIALVLTAISGWLSVASHASPSPTQNLPRTDTPSGYPVPRFVSLKASTTNCRVGPSLDHPKLLTYTKRGLPVRVIAETVDHWRKIEDRDGDNCWVHATLLTGTKTALVQQDAAALHAKPALGTFVRARLAHGLIARVHKCTIDWCKIQIGKQQGWVEKHQLWGAIN